MSGRHIRRSMVSAVLLLALATVAGAQLPIPGAPPAAVGATPPSPADPLGRDTPRGCILGFLRAAQDEDFGAAVQYFQPPARRTSTEAEKEIVTDLLDILNRKFGPLLDSVSRDPQGRLDDRLPPTQEKVGELHAGDAVLPLYLVQVPGPGSAKLWVFARTSLDHVTEFHGHLRFPNLESELPEVLVRLRLLSMPLWQWIAIVVAIPFALLIGWVLSIAGRLLVNGMQRLRKRAEPFADLHRIGPLTVLLSVMAHFAFVALLGTSLIYRQYYKWLVGVLVWFAVYWGLVMASRSVTGRVAKRLEQRGMLAEQSLLLIIRRFINIIVFLALALYVLSQLDVNLSTALAGLGIGGIAIGFGAQKTFENLFGGVSVLTDKVIRVGDTCKINDVVGMVEDIGLRSTQMRTLARTLVSLPNGTVASANVENLSQRDKILFQHVLGLRYETSADQLRFVLMEIRNLLYGHSRVESSTARVRFLRFSTSSLDVEVLGYILTKDFATYLGIQEDLLLRIMDIVESSGSGMAFPSHTMYLAKESPLNDQRTLAAEQAIHRLREKNELPFPDHDRETIAKIENTVEFPPPDSALRKPQG